MSREAMQQALDALTSDTDGAMFSVRCEEAIAALRTALAEQPAIPPGCVVVPVLTERERELIAGMIEVQRHHAAQCDCIANRTMAEKQKGWDLERVALLEKIAARPGKETP
jgi:uncharacterized protein YdaU (DUF1376 family)